MAASPEQKKNYQVVKAFKALNTHSNRTAIDETEFSWIENIQPIGYGNLKFVSQSSNVANVTWGNTVTHLDSAYLNGADYVFAAQADGRIEYYNITTSTKGTVANAGVFSGANVTFAQWKAERVMISDPNKGLYSWDGTSLIPVGCVSFIGITNVGSGYTTVPSVTISAPDTANGVQATAVASISNASGTITGFTMSNVGASYTSLPSVTIAPPTSIGGVQATASAILSSTGTIAGLNLGNPGYGYTTAPAVTITGGGGTNAAATAILGSGEVTAITLTNAGSGYTSKPTVTISGGGGANATAVAGFVNFNVGSVGILLNTGGTGYTSAPNVSITGGGGANAAATAIISGGSVVNIVVTNPGVWIYQHP